MRVELARVLALSKNIPPKLQKEIFLTGDKHAIYYLSKQEQLVESIQLEIVKSNEFTGQWSSYPNRPSKLITIAIANPQNDNTYMQLANQSNLTKKQASDLLRKNIPMVGYALAKRSNLPRSIRVEAIRCYSQILDLNSNHQNKIELAEMVGKKTKDWEFLTRDLNLDNLFLLTLAIESSEDPSYFHETYLGALAKIDRLIKETERSSKEVRDASSNRKHISSIYHYEDLTPSQSEYLKNIPEEKKKPLIQEVIQIYRKIVKSPDFSIENLKLIKKYPFFDKLFPEIDNLVNENYQKSYQNLMATKCKNGKPNHLHIKSLKHLLGSDTSINLNQLKIVDETLIHRDQLEKSEISRGLIRGNGQLVRSLGLLLSRERRYEEIRYFTENVNSLILDGIDPIDELLTYLAEVGCKATLESRVYERNIDLIVYKYANLGDLLVEPTLLSKVVEIIEKLPTERRYFCYSMLMEWEDSLEALISASVKL